MRVQFEELDPKLGSKAPVLRLVIELTTDNTELLKCELNELYARFNINYNAISGAVYNDNWGMSKNAYSVFSALLDKINELKDQSALK